MTIKKMVTQMWDLLQFYYVLKLLLCIKQNAKYYCENLLNLYPTGISERLTWILKTATNSLTKVSFLYLNSLKFK